MFHGCGYAKPRGPQVPQPYLRRAASAAATGAAAFPSCRLDEGGSLELLCTKPGEGSLALGDQLLSLKEAKPLPSSD